MQKFYCWINMKEIKLVHKEIYSLYFIFIFICVQHIILKCLFKKYHLQRKMEKIYIFIMFILHVTYIYMLINIIQVQSVNFNFYDNIMNHNSSKPNKIKEVKSSLILSTCKIKREYQCYKNSYKILW